MASVTFIVQTDANAEKETLWICGLMLNQHEGSLHEWVRMCGCGLMGGQVSVSVGGVAFA